MGKGIETVTSLTDPALVAQAKILVNSGSGDNPKSLNGTDLARSLRLNARRSIFDFDNAAKTPVGGFYDITQALENLKAAEGHAYLDLIDTSVAKFGVTNHKLGPNYSLAGFGFNYSHIHQIDRLQTPFESSPTFVDPLVTVNDNGEPVKNGVILDGSPGKEAPAVIQNTQFANFYFGHFSINGSGVRGKDGEQGVGFGNMQNDCLTVRNTSQQTALGEPYLDVDTWGVLDAVAVKDAERYGMLISGRGSLHLLNCLTLDNRSHGLVLNNVFDVSITEHLSGANGGDGIRGKGANLRVNNGKSYANGYNANGTMVDSFGEVHVGSNYHFDKNGIESACQLNNIESQDSRGPGITLGGTGHKVSGQIQYCGIDLFDQLPTKADASFLKFKDAGVVSGDSILDLILSQPRSGRLTSDTEVFDVTAANKRKFYDRVPFGLDIEAGVTGLTGDIVFARRHSGTKTAPYVTQLKVANSLTNNPGLRIIDEGV